MLPTLRDSIASQASTTTYASTFSSLRASTLGLTDSPASAKMEVSKSRSSVNHPTSDVVSSPHRLAEQRQISKPQLRTSVSNSSLDSAVQISRSRARLQRPVVKRPSNLAKTGVEEPHSSAPPRREGPMRLQPVDQPRTQANTFEGVSAPSRPISATSRPSSGTPRREGNEMSDPKSTESRPARPKQVARKPVPRSEPTHESPRVVMGRRIAQPAQPSEKPLPDGPSHSSVNNRKSPVSPTQTVDTMAEDWEAELIKNARQMDISGAREIEARREEKKDQREEQRAKDKEWERSGTWDSHRDLAREAEERTRRDAGREIAYPPAQPRIAIRAAPSGVTSIHVGVRPRLHPSRESESYNSNHPDGELPEPIFSPLQPSQAGNLPDVKGVRGSYNNVYIHELAEKAKGEYEAWKARKAEREGGVGEENDGYGTRDWLPKSRMVAQPGAVEGIAHSEGYKDTRSKPDDYVRPGSSDTPLDTPQEPNVWSQYGYPQYPGLANTRGEHWVYNMDPTQYAQGMWDPSVWWSMQGLQPQAEPSVPITEEHSRRVHFAESPDKLRHKGSQELPQVEQYGMDQLYDP